MSHSRKQAVEGVIDCDPLGLLTWSEK